MSDTVVIPAGNRPEAHFGKYKVLADLGEGAMGKVYKCFDPDFQRLVAIKTVHKALISDGNGHEFRERFRNEMRAAGKLTHPNIVSVFDAGERDGSPFFVMEFVEGQELKSMLDSNEVFSVEESLSIVKGVLRGLSSIHKNGITHRDLKPANIFVSNTGLAKIADFGIAKLDNSDMTQVGTIIGSPKYMSPEQCMGEPVDPRCDLFAVGIILYELLTGEYCFQASTTTDITQKILNATVAPPSKVRNEVPGYLDKVISKALSKKAGDRYQNAVEFLNAIDQKTGSGSNPSSNKLWIPGAAAGILVLGGAGWWFSQSGSDIAPTQSNLPAQNESRIENASKSAPAQTSGLAGQNGANGSSPSSGLGVNSSNSLKSSKTEVETLSPEKSAKLAKLFKVAETYQRIGRLVSPSGSNAYDAYQIALSIDPNNAEALSGIESVKSALIDSIKSAIDAGNKEQAKLSAQAGREVFPSDAEFETLLASIQ